MINPDTGNRIKMVTQDAETGKALERLGSGQRVVSSVKKDHYLLLKEEDFDSVKVRRARP